MAPSSKVEFKGLSPFERRCAAEAAGHPEMGELEQLQRIRFEKWTEEAERYAENVVGVFPMPIGIANHFKINRVERLVPMVTEERSVVAAASKAAKLCANGFRVNVGPPIGHGQVMFMRLPMTGEKAEAIVREHAAADIDDVRKTFPKFESHGGGLKELRPLAVETAYGHGLEVNFLVDTREAMGANGITEIGRRLGELLGLRLDARPLAAICLNDNPERWVEVHAFWHKSAGLTDPQIEGVLMMQEWAEVSPDRAKTHHKGIMNGIDAVCQAAMQDVRAVEAGAWAQAYSNGICRPLTHYQRTREGSLFGSLKIQITVGTVGGATAHPVAVWARRLMKAENVRELMAVAGAVGLAQNFAALLCLAGEGIDEAHRRLNAGRENNKNRSR